MTDPNDIGTNNVELRKALGRLRDSVAGERASDPLEANLVQAFRAHNSRKSAVIRKWAWAPAVIIAAGSMAGCWAPLGQPNAGGKAPQAGAADSLG